MHRASAREAVLEVGLYSSQTWAEQSACQSPAIDLSSHRDAEPRQQVSHEVGRIFDGQLV